MRLAKFNTKLTQAKEIAGLFKCTLEHEIKATTGKASWDGPKFPEQMWREVLAFFRWTYNETKSESQVRLFVNPLTRTWAAWAFPQQGNTGMASRELTETSDVRTAQRAQFSDADGWIPFGTVHHHCAAGAFQSGGDLHGAAGYDGEFMQDGIHLTVGKLASKQYDIHARFYWARNTFEPDLSEFFEVGDLINEVPAWAQQFLEASTPHLLAAWKMTVPPDEALTFPETWKQNFIIPPPPKVSNIYQSHDGGLGYQPKVYNKRERFNAKWDLDKATRQINEIVRTEPLIIMDDIVRMLEDLDAAGDVGKKVVEILQDNEVTVGPLLDHLQAVFLSEANAAIREQEEAEEAKANGHKKHKKHKHKDAPLLTDGTTVNEQGDLADKYWQHLV